jgi:hypothetical protein
VCEVNYQTRAGEVYRCSLPDGHKGDCDFERSE